jgi:hypothetical protein
MIHVVRKSRNNYNVYSTLTSYSLTGVTQHWACDNALAQAKNAGDTHVLYIYDEEHEREEFLINIAQFSAHHVSDINISKE